MITFKTLPKYESLTLNLPTIETNCLNIIVDLKSYIQLYYSNNYRFSGDQAVDVADIISKMMSIISHYRNYFFRIKGLRTKFYFLYSLQRCKKLLSIHPNYKKKIYQKIDDANTYNKECVDKALPLIVDLVNYTSGCIFVDTSDFDENCYIRYIVDSSPEISLILTKYPYEVMPVLNERSLVLETYTDRILYYLYNRAQVARTIILGSQAYGLKSSHVSVERYDDAWAIYLQDHDLIKNDTAHNPLDYSKMEAMVTKKPSIAKSVLTHKSDQEFAFTILSGAAFYHANKPIMATKLSDTHPKYTYAEYSEVNDLFGMNPLNVRGLLRGYI